MYSKGRLLLFLKMFNGWGDFFIIQCPILVTLIIVRVTGSVEFELPIVYTVSSVFPHPISIFTTS